MTSRVLVPGGAGYIGSHVVQQLVLAGHDVVVLDNLSTGFRESVHPGAELVEVDLANTHVVRSVITEGDFDAVMHFAASIVVPESMADPLKYYMNNTVNTTNLVQACVDAGVHRFIFSSTAAVYGTPDGGAAAEDSPTEPINPYGRSKLMSEWVLRDVAAATDLRYVALRYFNVAGAALDGSLGQRTKEATHLIKVASQAALGLRKRLAIYGTDYDTRDGTCVRDYIHVEDLARAHLDSLGWLTAGGTSQILNCGYGEGTTVREVLDAMRDVSGVDFAVDEGPRRAGDPPSLVAKADRIQEILGWVPKYDKIKLICRSALDWEEALADEEESMITMH